MARKSRSLNSTPDTSDRLWTGQSQVLEMIAQGRPSHEVLEAIALWVEAQFDGLICAFFLVDAEGRALQLAVAPSLAADARQTLLTLAISPTGSCCGAAAYRRAPVLVQNTATDPLWQSHRALAQAHRLRASWSTPLFSTGGDLLGILTLYTQKPRAAKLFAHPLLGIARQLASFAIAPPTPQRFPPRSAGAEDNHGTAAGISPVPIAQAETGQSATSPTAIAPLRNDEYRSVIAALNDGIVVQSATGMVLECNPSAARILGVQLQTHHRSPLLDPQCHYIRDDGSRLAVEVHPITLTLKTGRACTNVVLGMQKPNGVLTWIMLNTQPLFHLGDVQPYAVVCSFADITERKQTQAALQRSEARYRAIVEDQTELVCRFLPDGTLTFVNDAYCAMLGIPREELLGYNYRMFLLALNQVDETNLTTMVTPENPVSLLETQMILPTGELRWHQWNNRAIYNAQGVLVEFQAVGRDITERKRIEETLRQTTERLNGILRSLDDVVWSAAVDGSQVFYVSPACEKVFGYTEQQLCDRPSLWLEIIHPDDRPRVEALLSDLPATGMLLAEYRLIHPDEGVRWVYCRSWLVRDDQGNPLRVDSITSDITERKQAEADLLRQNQRAQMFAEITLKIRQSLDLADILQTTVMEVQQLLQADRVLLYRIHPDGSGTVVTEALNSGWQSLLGAALLPEVSLEESRQWVTQGQLRAIANVQTDNIPNQTAIFLQRLEVQAELVVPILQRDRLWGFLIVHQCDRPRQWLPFERELLQQLGNQVGIALAQSQLVESLRESEENILKALAKERELSELKSRFVSMVSHEFRTPLTTIQSSAELLEYYEWTAAERQERFQQIRTAVQHMTQLLEDVLLIGKVDSGRVQCKPKPIDVQAFCQELLADLQLTTSDRHRVFFHTTGIPKTVALDPKLLRQILSNLLSNAVKYSPEGGDVALLVDYQTDRLQFSVRDQGIGIPLEDQEHLFEAFYRATNVDTIQGTGLGLAIVKKCVDLHGGEIKCESSVGSGTVFIVTLPTGQFAEETLYG